MLINIREAAVLINIPPKSLASRRHRLKGFPKPKQIQGATYLYDSDEVKAYGEMRKRKPIVVKKQPINVLALSKAFISGKYDAKAKQSEYEKRKVKAAKAKAVTVRVTISPDWLEDA